MPNFSEGSLQRLGTCHEDLRRLMLEVVKYVDITILVGYRDEAAQNLAVQTGMSKTPWPDSKHNTAPSVAVDVALYPIEWDNLEGFHYLAGLVRGVAETMGIKIRWGGDWSQDLSFNRNLVKPLNDLDHFELVL